MSRCPATHPANYCKIPAFGGVSTHSPTLAPKGRIHAELTWNTPPGRTDRPPARGVRGQRRERARHRRHSAQRALFLRTRLSRTVLCDLGLNAPTPTTAREPEHRHRSNVVLRSRSGAGAVSDLGARGWDSAFGLFDRSCPDSSNTRRAFRMGHPRLPPVKTPKFAPDWPPMRLWTA